MREVKSIILKTSSMVYKTLVSGVIVLFLGTCIAPTVAIDNEKKTSNPISNGNTLYVGGSGEGNYTRIQDAIDNASDGDTVFVFDESSPYYENIKIGKSIKLIGENKYSTIIDGNQTGDVIYIKEYANGGTIQGFTIQNSGDETWEDAGIEISGYFDSISDNIIIKNWLGIANLKYYSYVYGYFKKITNNIITGNELGICIESYGDIFSETDIYKNYIANNSCGIFVSYDGYSYWFNENRNNLYQNNITNNEYGIVISNEMYQNIYNNNITENQNGITLYSIHGICYKNNIYENNIERNKCGIELYNGCTSNTYENNIYLNNLKNNNNGVIIKNDEYGFCPSGNNFYQNNFINNIISGKIEPKNFLSRFSNNIWEHNYWNRPRLLPKIIKSPYIILSLYNTDWRPAKEPYDINV